MVHFNRLKPCPADIRCNTDGEQGQSSSSQNELPTENQPPPPGTNVQLIDNDEDYRPTDTVTQSTRLSRYPTRTRNPPRRLGDCTILNTGHLLSKEGMV